MAKFQRETATHEADLPHEFQLSPFKRCELCDTAPDDPRHQAWEKQVLLDREHANLQLKREIGS